MKDVIKNLREKEEVLRKKEEQLRMERKKLRMERTKLDKIYSSMHELADATQDVFKFNVSGTNFEISKEIIMKYPGTLFSDIISTNPFKKDANGRYLIEKDPKNFAVIMDYYKTDKYVGSLQ
jgi:hypothetical protein